MVLAASGLGGLVLWRLLRRKLATRWNLRHRHSAQPLA